MEEEVGDPEGQAGPSELGGPAVGVGVEIQGCSQGLRAPVWPLGHRMLERERGLPRSSLRQGNVAYEPRSSMVPMWAIEASERKEKQRTGRRCLH